MAAQYLLQYCNVVVFLCLLHIPWISMDILSEHDCVLVKLESETQIFGHAGINHATFWLTWFMRQTRWQSHLYGLGAWNLFFLGWDPWCGLKNRVPHVIDHGWWFVQWWLGAWVFAPGSSESRAQETQRLWQLKLRSGWAVVSDGPRSPATIRWSFFCGTYIQRCDKRREQWTPVKMCSTRLNSNHNYWNSQFNFLVYAPFSETCSLPIRSPFFFDTINQFSIFFINWLPPLSILNIFIHWNIPWNLHFFHGEIMVKSNFWGIDSPMISLNSTSDPGPDGAPGGPERCHRGCHKQRPGTEEPKRRERVSHGSRAARKHGDFMEYIYIICYIYIYILYIYILYIYYIYIIYIIYI